MGCDFEFSDGEREDIRMENYRLRRNINRYGSGHMHAVFREVERPLGLSRESWVYVVVTN